MGLRETFNDKPGLAAGAAGGLILVGLILIVFQFRGPTAPAAPSKAFFTVDDGKTWFADDASKLPPFDKGGKQAVRAYVFKSASGKEFVNHLERFTAAAKQVLDAPKSDAKAANFAALQGAFIGGREVKRPGEEKWTPSSKFKEASQVLTVKAPDGTSDATEVEP